MLILRKDTNVKFHIKILRKDLFNGKVFRIKIVEFKMWLN